MRWVYGLWMICLVAVSPFAQSDVSGAWRAETFVLADVSEYSVSGSILFTESDWSVLFFVENDAGNVRRGSGEGGTYTLEGNRLTFTHLYHSSAGEEGERWPRRRFVCACASAPKP